MESLLSKRKELIRKKNLVVRDYRIQKINSDIIKSIGAVNEKIYSSEMKKLEKEYKYLREEVYSVEDKISELDMEVMDNIVEPNPEDIESAIHMYTDSEWNNMK